MSITKKVCLKSLLIAAVLAVVAVTSNFAQNAFAGTRGDIETALPSVFLDYDVSAKSFYTLVNGSPEEGGELLVTYGFARKNAIARVDSLPILRYSFDGGITWLERTLTPDPGNDFASIIKIAENAAEIQMAVVVPCQWGPVWDSDYGRNIRVPVKHDQSPATVKTTAAIFDYDTRTGVYANSLNGTVFAGSDLKITYKKSRKEKLMPPKVSAIYIYYSNDFGKNFRKEFISATKSGDFEFILPTNKNDRQLQIAFCAYDRYGHEHWDSNFGGNFIINVVPASELEKREKFESLENNAR